jgi:hypothetical protein
MSGPRFPTEHHARLGRFVGRWRGEEQLSPSPWDPIGGVARGRFESRLDLGGFFLLVDYSQERPSSATFYGHGVYGWDGEHYTMHWFDSDGRDPGAPNPGVWDGDTLTFERSGPTPARFVYTFVGPDAYRFTMSASLDGGATWTTYLDGTYTQV